MTAAAATEKEKHVKHTYRMENLIRLEDKQESVQLNEERKREMEKRRRTRERERRVRGEGKLLDDFCLLFFMFFAVR